MMSATARFKRRKLKGVLRDEKKVRRTQLIQSVTLNDILSVN